MPDLEPKIRLASQVVSTALSLPDDEYMNAIVTEGRLAHDIAAPGVIDNGVPVRDRAVAAMKSNNLVGAHQILTVLEDPTLLDHPHAASAGAAALSVACDVVGIDPAEEAAIRHRTWGMHFDGTHHNARLN